MPGKSLADTKKGSRRRRSLNPMECLPAFTASQADEGREHVVAEKPTTLLRVSSSLQRRPVLAMNGDIGDARQEIVRSISKLQAPTFVKRDTSISATVNMGAALEDGMQPVGRAFQRLASQRMDSSARLPTIPHDREAPTTEAGDAQVIASTSHKAEGGRPHSLARMVSWTASRKLLDVAIKREQQQQPARQVAEHVRLRERMARLHLVEHEQIGDGNCQFRAISHQLYDTPKWHQNIRRKAVAHMKADSDFFVAFLGEDFDDYCKEMLMAGTWGDELTLRAAADGLGVTIHVVTSEAENWYMVYEPTKQLLKKEIFLSYVSPIHYNSLTRMKRSPSAPL
mmetsp:Transcript_17786/g.44756  ORF Transcript_17786/g.44756 Transcript_17786/m.44756 type:complete len:340 (-) Transcript_17786:91-1110(-)